MQLNLFCIYYFWPLKQLDILNFYMEFDGIHFGETFF